MSAFVSYDGDGTEVYVSTATAKVTSIEEKNNSVNVIFKASYLDHPMNGWLNANEESLTILRKAKEDDKEVEIRIEAQRKPKVDKSIPIQEIREGKSAKTDIIKKIASVNGVFSSEALTNPEDDPATGRAKSALGRTSAPKQESASTPAANKGSILSVLFSLSTAREVSESVLDAVKAQALIAGATVQEITDASTIDNSSQPIQQNGFSREAPPFKEYNNDGRLNLGGPAIASGVGVYNYVFDKLAKKFEEVPNEDTVEYVSALILSMADVIQAGVYGKGFRPDRSAGSHVRARACLFSVIDLNSLPVTNSGLVAPIAEVNAWVRKVGAAARNNFITGITLSQQFPSVKDLLSFVTDDGLVADAAPSTPVATESVSKPSATPAPKVAPETFSKPVEKHTEAPTPITEPTVDEIVEEPTPAIPETKEIPEWQKAGGATGSFAVAGYKSEPTYDVAPAPVVEKAERPAVKEAVVVDDGLIRFEQKLLPPGAINSSNAPSEDILAQFKEFVIEETGLKTKGEQAQVGKLLAATFGRAYGKASNIPEDDLADFLDFYVSTGVENFKAVLASA